MSSTGECFDIGMTVRRALRHYEDAGNPFSGSEDPQSAGNGSLMRLAPVPLFFARDQREAIRLSGESSRTTHAAAACIDACRYFDGLIAGAVLDASKRELLSDRYSAADGRWPPGSLCAEIDGIARGSFREKEPPAIVGSGHVVRSLEAALWAFDKADNFREGYLPAANLDDDADTTAAIYGQIADAHNLGDDADTTAAIYGQIADAHYGINGIPESWRIRIVQVELITRPAEGLLHRA